MKRDFNIKYQPDIESGRYKVVTISGDDVDIIGFEYNHGKYPILAIIHKEDGDTSLWYDKDGEYDPQGAAVYNNAYNLVVVTDEPELTEFQSAIYELLKSHGTDYSDDLKSIKDMVDLLLPLAQKELLSRGFELLSEEERQSKKKVVYEPFECAREFGYKEGFKAGKISVLQDVPKWKKMVNGFAGGAENAYLIKNYSGSYRMSSTISPDDTYIVLNELERLPNE